MVVYLKCAISVAGNWSTFGAIAFVCASMKNLPMLLSISKNQLISKISFEDKQKKKKLKKNYFECCIIFLACLELLFSNQYVFFLYWAAENSKVALNRLGFSDKLPAALLSMSLCTLTLLQRRIHWVGHKTFSRCL